MTEAPTSSAAPKATLEPNNRLAGKVALITGGTRGIGFAVARAFVLEGARVIIAARSASDLKDRRARLEALVPGSVTAAQVDLSTPVEAERLYTAATKTFGKIDVLVNNAAVLGPRAAMADYPFAAWREVMATNLDGTFLATQGVLGHMIPNNGGSIINVTSAAGANPKAKWGAYAVSKAAMDCMTRMIAEEVATYNIRVNGVNPGPVRTKMRAEAMPGEDPNSLTTPEDITNVFVYLASDASRGVTGQTLDAREWMGRNF